MSYQALYRKYRPRNFDEVVGQSVAKKTLQNALKTGKISHAYLFSGPRGTGKTTIAKIFAKSVNCLQADNGNPCQKCSSCVAISERECPDIIEIDAASNNGVDEIRELRNKVNLVPSELKYKVYIIDEVHMLSIGAFNALLKTLEEPPAHVIFILATTDLHKVPITIISRCQCFSFKRISDHDMIERLNEIVRLEDIEVEEDVLQSISDYSDGGMRDALGMLDKLTSYANGRITMDDMREINGLLSEKDIIEFIEKVKESNIPFVLKQLEFYYQTGKDLIRFVEELILNLRNQLIDKYLNGNDQIDDDFVNHFAVQLNKILNDLKNSSNLKVLLEIELLYFMNSIQKSKNSGEVNEDRHSFANLDSQKTKINDNHSQQEEKNHLEEEKKGENNHTITQFDQKIGENDVKILNSDDPLFLDRLRVRINNTFALATKDDLLRLKNRWKEIMDFTLDNEIGAVACFLIDSVPVAASSKNVILTFEYPSMVERGNDMIDRIEITLNRIFDQNYHVVLLTMEEWNREKQQFIENRNQHISYEYQEEPNVNFDEVKDSKDVDDSDLAKMAIQLFGKNIVKIDD